LDVLYCLMLAFRRIRSI